MVGRWRRVPLGVFILAHRARCVNFSFDFFCRLFVAVVVSFVGVEIGKVVLARVPAATLALLLLRVLALV